MEKNSRQFFEDNKDKIRLTARFLCEIDGANLDDKLNELRQEYYLQKGTNHKEVLNLNGSSYALNTIVENIRDKECEHFMIYAFYNDKVERLYHVIGEQFSCANINLDDIRRSILNLYLSFQTNNINIFVLHNHPYIYRAAPSIADLEALEALFVEMNDIERIIKGSGGLVTINIVDYSIVTEFDYWSFKQTN